MGSALKIRDDLRPLELRRWARVESYGRAAARAYGIANALEEMPRADAARLAGMDRQTLRDAVVRYNAKGLEGLHDRPKGYSPRRLTADEEAALAAVIIAGPEPERDGVCAWTRADLCRWLEERFAKTYHPSSMTRVLRRMGFSRQKARPSHPRRDAEAQERISSKKGASRHPEGPSPEPDRRHLGWLLPPYKLNSGERVGATSIPEATPPRRPHRIDPIASAYR